MGRHPSRLPGSGIARRATIRNPSSDGVEDDEKPDENHRGGGARLPALLLALTCILGWTAVAPHEAAAADAVAIPGCDAKGWSTAGVGSVTYSFTRAGRPWSIALPGMTIKGPDGIESTAGEFQINDRNIRVDSQCRTTEGTLLTYPDGRGTDFGEISDEPMMYVTDDGDIILFNEGGMRVDQIAPLGDGWTLADHGTVTYEGHSYRAKRLAYRNARERELTMNANGGAWDGALGAKRQIIDTTYAAVTEDRPTRDGYRLSGWNTKPDGTGVDASTDADSLADGQTLYAQWIRESKPSRATISCAPYDGNGNGVKCAVIAYYADAPEQARELTAHANNALSWGDQTPIDGIRLDQNGYAGDVSCILRSTTKGASQCYYVSVADRPTQSDTPSTVVQSPTAGAPVSDLTIPALAVGGGLAALGFGLSRRRRA